jgi:hypothetical protein
VRAGRLVTWGGAAGRRGLDLVLELGKTWRSAVFGACPPC